MPWYRRWWGIVALAALTGVVVVGALVAVMTARYYRALKGGAVVELLRPSYDGFTAAGAAEPEPAGLAGIELSPAQAPQQGSKQAPVTIVEFIDFKCPFCRAAAPVMKQVRREYGHKVNFVVRHFPVESIHPGATELAKMGYCAHAQGRFWQFHDYLFEHQDEISDRPMVAGLTALWQQLDFDVVKLFECIQDSATLTAINRDYTDGIRAGVAGTPTFFVNGERVQGVVPFSAWQEYLENVQ